ncbi:MAG: transposase [Candidatus Zambryskibacteria bacterium]
MRNRDYKEFAPDSYYHVFNRGNAKMDIFLDQEDYKFFLWRLKENLFPSKAEKNRRAPSANLPKERYVRKLLPPNSFSLVCYCLMPNHFHLLIRQNSKIKISELMLRVCGSYAKYFNKKYDRVGSLFQDQFKATLINKNNYLLWLSTYIHKNPQKGGLVNKLEDWKWSSYLDYIDQSREDFCDKKIILDQLNSDKYKAFVNQSFDKDKILELNAFLLDLE